MNEEQTNALSSAVGDPGGMHCDTSIEAQGGSPEDDAMLTEVAAGVERHAISDFQAAADAFNATFNTALYELEASRRERVAHIARISELDDAIETMRDALESELEKGSRREEEYARERAELRQQIEGLESERDRLQAGMREQEDNLQARAEEISALSGRIEQQDAALAEQLDHARREGEEAGQEIDRLGNELASLQAQFAAAEDELRALRQTLEERDSEITELRGRYDRQSEELRRESEQHASARDELNLQIADTSRELEVLRTAHGELVAHAEKLESLNNALHESSVTQGAVHKQKLEEKTGELEQLRSRLDAVNAKLKTQSERASELESRLMSLHEQESGLQVQARGPDTAGDAGEAGTPEVDADSSQQLGMLEERVAELQALLEASHAEQASLTEQLHGYQELRDEVVHLRDAAGQAESEQDERARLEKVVESSKMEADTLRTALAEAERKYDALQASFAGQAECRDADVPQVAEQVASPGVPLIDRSRFSTELNSILAARNDSDTGHSLMYILLDSFVQVRDEIGVMDSERVINDVGGVITSLCGPDEMVSRFGDSAFVVVCSGESLADTEQRAERIRAAIEGRTFDCGERSVHMTASIGICPVRAGDTRAEEVIARAERACEAARSYGGNQVLASSSVAENVAESGARFEQEDIVRTILEEGRARLYYQPITSLKDNLKNHFEILIRIVDENGNIILPGEFVSMAVKCGCAADVDRYVVEHVMKMMAENRGQHMMLFIKLTGGSVADHSFPVWLLRKAKEYRINTQQLVFEIPETVLLGDIKNLSMLARALNAIGCRIAIEHYRLESQLRHLMHFRAHYLKIDSGLMQGLSSKGDSLAKVSAIMKMAKQSNCITIAEGVESSAALAILMELGVDMAQGYFIQAPAEERDFEFQSSGSDDMQEGMGKASFTIQQYP